ncbi:MAG: alternative ribosome rescue aminoacyl-tRNA hydrolase ArfB [Bacteroidota bacterium]|jgi:ribosome-associated protein
MKIDLTSELQFRTARSSGAGGQHVNKVETRVLAIWDISSSHLLTDEQKGMVNRKLANLINKNGELILSSQVHRTQFANKEDVIKKINKKVQSALVPKKPRIASRPTHSSIENRIEAKKKTSQIKSGRKKIRREDL